MEKFKAWFVTLAIMTLLGGEIYLLWCYAIRSFWVVTMMFGIYGFFCFGVHLGKWMVLPPISEALPKAKPPAPIRPPSRAQISARAMIRPLSPRFLGGSGETF